MVFRCLTSLFRKYLKINFEFASGQILLIVANFAESRFCSYKGVSESWWYPYFCGFPEASGNFMKKSERFVNPGLKTHENE
jgi:hypothetical protein